MVDDDRTPTDEMDDHAPVDLGQSFDLLFATLTKIAGSHTDLLAHVAEAEARRSQDARDMAHRIDALERQVLALPSHGTSNVAGVASGPPADLEPLRADLTLALEVLAQLTESVQQLEARSDSEAATIAAPIGDLRTLFSAHKERQEAQLSRLTDAVAELRDRPGDDAGADVLEQVKELAVALQGISTQLPDLSDDVAALRQRVERFDVNELSGRLALHTDIALAGALRVIDDRLGHLRSALADGGGGFEAGAAVGAAQVAWNRLEQRLDNEFDDLGRQLQAMAGLIDKAATTAEALANRPAAMTGEQLRKAAYAVKDSVTNAGRTRRDRRGGPRGLGSGS